MPNRRARAHGRALLAAVALLLAGCGDDDQAAAPSPTSTPTPTPTALPGGDLVRCQSPEGFSLARPRSWSVNEGDVVPPCSRLHPERFEVPEGTDERVAAISVSVDPVPFSRVATADRGRDGARAVTTIDGRQAVRLAYESRGRGLWPEGTPITQYAIDLAPAEETLLIDTIGLDGFDYERNQRVLDRIVRTIEVTRGDAPADEGIVARYGGGGGGLTVTSGVRGSQVCLRIPPGGEWICTDEPAADQLHTIQLTDLEPVLAGVAGSNVFRVTAERRGGGRSSFLPAPIEGTDARGLGFTFPLGDVERLRLFDVTGAELRTIEPGGP